MRSLSPVMCKKLTERDQGAYRGNREKRGGFQEPAVGTDNNGKEGDP